MQLIPFCQNTIVTVNVINMVVVVICSYTMYLDFFLVGELLEELHIESQHDSSAILAAPRVQTN